VHIILTLSCCLRDLRENCNLLRQLSSKGNWVKNNFLSFALRADPMLQRLVGYLAFSF
jgi:hypothetical protein